MKKKHQKTKMPKGWEFLVVLIVLAAGIYIGAFLLISRLPSGPYTATRDDSTKPVPPFYRADQVPNPLPPTLAPATFTRADITEAYRVAEEIPEVLAQQPCYCGCERHGHRSLHACYASDHAVDCPICLKEALWAGKLHREGKNPSEIRESIIREEWRAVDFLGVR